VFPACTTAQTDFEKAIIAFEATLATPEVTSHEKWSWLWKVRMKSIVDFARQSIEDDANAASHKRDKSD